MLAWRITKYNPKNRNEKGHYLIDEWTAYSDIGKNINGKVLTYPEYLTIENAYINAISLFMNCNNLTELSVFRLEKYFETTKDLRLDTTATTLFQRIKKGLTLNKNEVEAAARLVLREELWCLLRSVNTMVIRFGFDYYMYIGSTKQCDDVIKKIQQSRLFVEICDPEYLK